MLLFTCDFFRSLYTIRDELLAYYPIKRLWERKGEPRTMGLDPTIFE